LTTSVSFSFFIEVDWVKLLMMLTTHHLIISIVALSKLLSNTLRVIIKLITFFVFIIFLTTIHMFIILVVIILIYVIFLIALLFKLSVTSTNSL
jgi:hypothetical protein